VTRASGLAWLGALVTSLAVACASGSTAPGPVSEAPKKMAGERLRGPDAGADVVEAESAPPPRGADRLDWNGDHHVDLEEFRNYFTRVFHKTDANDDRLLTGDELATLPPDAVKQADRNGDGALDVEEYVDLTLLWFARCDRNQDDVLGPDEEQACIEADTQAR